MLLQKIVCNFAPYQNIYPPTTTKKSITMANLKKIRTLCEAKKITIRELAKKIGRDESSIQSAIRRGSTNSARRARRIFLRRLD